MLHAFKIKFNLLFKGKTPMKNLKVKTEERERVEIGSNSEKQKNSIPFAGWHAHAFNRITQLERHS